MSAPIIRVVAAVAGPQDCAAGVIEQLCSSVTNFLNEESAKADADAKACKKNCGWKKRKDDLLDAAKKKAKESCAKGEVPDAQELSKGLDRNTKDRLKDLYDRNSRLFDGKAKLEAANFGAVASKNTTITGKGGKVTDLKSSEPDLPKLNSGTEFSLAKPSTLIPSTKISALAAASAVQESSSQGCSRKIESYYDVDPKTCKPFFMESANTDVTTWADYVNKVRSQLENCSKNCEQSQQNLTFGESKLKCATEYRDEILKLGGDCTKKKECLAADKDWVNNACMVKCEYWETRNAAGKCEKTPIKKPAEVLGIAEGYLGAPYANPADCSKSTKQSGLDCSCLAEKTNPGFFQQADKITEKECGGTKEKACNKSLKQYLLMGKKGFLKYDIKDLIPADYIFYKKESFLNNKWEDEGINHVNILIKLPKLDEKNRWDLYVYNATPGNPSIPGSDRLYAGDWYLINVEKKRWWEFWKFWKRDKWCQCNNKACTSRECFAGGGFPK